MRFKAVRKKYRCKCKFAWLPVKIDKVRIWLERYYVLQSWDHRLFKLYWIGWETDYLMTYDKYLSVKNDAMSSKFYSKYIKNVKES